MKFHRAAIAAIFSISALGALPAAAQDSEAACGVLLCMSSPDSGLPHQCKPYVESYFDIKVYKRGSLRTKFDPVRTAKKRYETILSECGGARQEDRDRVHARFGMLEHSPFIFN